MGRCRTWLSSGKCWPRWEPGGPCPFGGPAAGRKLAEKFLERLSGSGRFPGEGHGNPLQYSCLHSSLPGGAWQAIVCGVAKSQTRPRNSLERQWSWTVPWSGFPRKCTLQQGFTCKFIREEIPGSWWGLREGRKAINMTSQAAYCCGQEALNPAGAGGGPWNSV